MKSRTAGIDVMLTLPVVHDMWVRLDVPKPSLGFVGVLFNQTFAGHSGQSVKWPTSDRVR